MKWSIRIGCGLLVTSILVVAQSPQATGRLPATLNDQEFWRMIEDFSEPGGTFRYENFVSNERSIQYVIPELKAKSKPGGVYIGVAPEQNFTYVAAIQPGIAFVSTKVVAKSKDQFEVTGNLTIRGVTKQITLPVSYLGEQKDPWGNTKAGFETGITITRQDFGLVWNKAIETGGFLVGDEVQIAVNLEAAKDVAPVPTN